MDRAITYRDRKGNWKSMSMNIQTEADQINDRRFPLNFIPRYANGYFDRGLEMRVMLECLFLYMPRLALAFMGFVFLFEHSVSAYFQGFFLAAMLLWGVNNLFLPPLRTRKLGIGYLLVPNGIYELAAGQKLGKLYSYDVVKRAIRRGRYYYLSDRLVIDCGRLKLAFYFEHGDAYAYAHTKQVYRLLSDKLGMQMPPLTDEIANLSKIKESYRQQWFVGYVLGIFVPFALSLGMGYSSMYDATMGIMTMAVLFMGGIELFGIFWTFRNAFRVRAAWSRLRNIDHKLVQNRFLEGHLCAISVITVFALAAICYINVVYVGDQSGESAFFWNTKTPYVRVSQQETMPDEYYILVTPSEDGTVRLTYHIERTVSAMEGQKEYDLLMPNSYISQVVSLSPGARYVSYKENEHDIGYIHIGFDRIYRKKERYTLDFQYRALCMSDRDGELGEYRYQLLPNLPRSVDMAHTMILWDAECVKNADGTLVKLEDIITEHPVYEQMIENVLGTGSWSDETLAEPAHEYYLWKLRSDGSLDANVWYGENAFTDYKGDLYRRYYMNPVRWIGLIMGSVLPFLALLIALIFARDGKKQGRTSLQEELIQASELIQDMKPLDMRVQRQIYVDETRLGGNDAMYVKHIEETEKKASDFLPVQSKFEVERMLSRKSTLGNVLLVGGAFLFVVAMTDGGISTGLKVVGSIWCLLVIKVFVIDPLRIKAKSERGFEIAEDGLYYVKKKDGAKEFMDYSVVRNAVEHDKVKYKAIAMVIDCGKHKICFPYEIGETDSFKRVVRCYERIKTLAKVELPPLDSALGGYMDQKYFFKKRIKRGIIAELIGELFCFLMTVSAWQGLETGHAVAIFIFSAMTCIGAAMILHSSIYLKKIVQKMFGSYKKAATDSKLDRHAVWLAVINFLVVVLLHVLMASSIMLK